METKKCDCAAPLRYSGHRKTGVESVVSICPRCGASIAVYVDLTSRSVSVTFDLRDGVLTGYVVTPENCSGPEQTR